jgi:hypothetical protein
MKPYGEKSMGIFVDNTNFKFHHCKIKMPDTIFLYCVLLNEPHTGQINNFEAGIMPEKKK